MAYDRFLIAPLQTGLETDLKPWQTPDDSFSELNNAYVFRGRVRKRFGSQLTGTTHLNSRLRIFLKNTDGAGAAAGNVPGVIWKVGQMFSVGAEVFTVYNPAAGAQVMYSTTGTSTTLTYNLTNGAYVFAGSAIATPVYFYPGDPVMGLTMYE